MKHPALTRIFAIVLAILCLAMLLAGAGIVRSALRERDKGRADLTRLRDRMDEYAQILRQLEGTTRFEEIDRELSERQGAHDEQAVRHRTDLAIYTATRSGLLTGAASLREAADALAQGRAQYEAGLAMFQEQEAAFYEGYAQFQEGKRQLAEARATLDMTAQALAATRAQLAQLRSLSAVLESDDPDARLELSVETYDLLLGSMDQAMGMYGQLKDQGGISAEQMQMLATMLAQQYGVDADEFLENVEWQGIDAATMEEWETRIVEATGMTPEELRAQIQEQRDSIGGEDGQQPLSEEQFAALQAAYALNKAQIDAMASVLEEQIAVYEAQLADAQAQMDEAQAQIDAMDAYMEQGKTAIEQGRAALDAAGGQLWSGQKAIDDGFAQIREKEAELDEQEEELRKEKTQLDSESAELSRRSEEAAAQKELEQREISLRVLLMERPEIAQRVDAGMDLMDAAEDLAAQLERDTEHMAKGRLWTSLVMALGAIAGFAAIPAAFEKTKSRFWLIAPVVLCGLCAVAAEVFCRVLGRGDSYSALGVAGFAAIQLAVCIPRPKKKT